jgi:hypothetical protein
MEGMERDTDSSQTLYGKSTVKIVELHLASLFLRFQRFPELNNEIHESRLQWVDISLRETDL